MLFSNRVVHEVDGSIALEPQSRQQWSHGTLHRNQSLLIYWYLTANI